MGKAFDLQVSFPTDTELDRAFDVIGAMDRYKCADRVVRAMGNVVLKRAKELVPRSANTGSTKLWSKKNAHRKGELPLWRSLRLIVRKTSKLSYALVGPVWREGQKAYFNLAYKKKSRAVWLWGRDANRTVPAIRNWMLQASDETHPQQLAAGLAELRKFVKDTYGG